MYRILVVTLLLLAARPFASTVFADDAKTDQPSRGHSSPPFLDPQAIALRGST